MDEIKFPEIEVELVGEDGNAFHLIGLVRKAIHRAGHRDEAVEFANEALGCGSYDELLRLIMATVSVV